MKIVRAKTKPEIEDVEIVQYTEKHRGAFMAWTNLRRCNLGPGGGVKLHQPDKVKREYVGPGDWVVKYHSGALEIFEQDGFPALFAPVDSYIVQEPGVPG